LDDVDFKRAIETLTGGAFKPNGPGNGHDRGGETLGPIVVRYNYEDENGELVLQVTRHHPKDFRQRRPDGHGGWIYSIDGVALVPYRLPELMEAIGKEQTIFIVEGEKDVDNVRLLGAPATCNPRGAGK